MDQASTKKKRLLGGYFSSMRDEDAKKRYLEKLHIIGGLDPYETEKNEWEDNVDLWPSITYVNLGMYLLVTPSPYSGEDLKNYKSLDCYKNFLSGWVREVLVRSVMDDQGVEKRVVTAKVCTTRCMLVIIIPSNKTKYKPDTTLSTM